MTSHESKTIAVANRFVTLLRAEVGRKNFAEVRRRNRAETDLAICHSHDFCDANVLMNLAVKQYVYGSRVVSADEKRQQREEYETIWNDAWSLVRRLHLS